MLCRSVLAEASLYRLSHRHGLIPCWLMKTRPHPLEADKEFWELCANNAQWLEQLRSSGLPEVADTVERDLNGFDFSSPLMRGAVHGNSEDIA